MKIFATHQLLMGLPLGVEEDKEYTITFNRADAATITINGKPHVLSLGTNEKPMLVTVPRLKGYNYNDERKEGTK